MAASNDVSNKEGYFFYDWTSAKYKWVAGKPDKAQGKIISEAFQHNIRDAKPCLHGNEGPLKDIDVNNFNAHKVDDSALGKDRPDGKPGSDSSRGSRCPPGEEHAMISQGHSTMQAVLTTRALRLKAAQTLWFKDTNEFIAYILRLDDDAIIVDVLSLLCTRVKESSSEEGYSVSMGACLEMLPALERLLKSKFEDYIVGALNMVREMIKRWWKQLKQASSSGESNPQNFRCSRSLNSLYMAMMSMTQTIEKLSKRSGQIGEKAKVVSRLLELL